MKSFRKQIRGLHQEFDGLVGRLFSSQKSLKRLDRIDPKVLLQSAQMNKYYSQKEHFSAFHILPVHKNQNPSTCDLKVYQDLFIYSFILEQVPYGSRILEIGGGESRLISELKEDYDIWNLDKLEGQGHGPKQLYTTEGFTLVKANIGEFSINLPKDFFDLVFSISVVEHFPEDKRTSKRIIKDLDRVMKKDAFSVHCIDCLFFGDRIWFHPFIHEVEKNGINLNINQITHDILNDDHLWTLPKYAYYTRWFPKTKQMMSSFGKPFSLNLIWQK